MRLARPIFRPTTIIGCVPAGLVACGSDSSPPTNEAGRDSGPDGSLPPPTPNADGGAAPGPTDGGPDSGKVLEDGLLDPVPYTSRADGPFQGVSFGSYFHFEDWEDGELSTPGVTASSTTLGTSFGVSLVDSVDEDDGVVDGKCSKVGGACNSAYGAGTIEFTFDAAVLGGLPTHVRIAWTDGAPGRDATFEAFDADDVSLGTRTVEKAGDESNAGTVAEDPFFAVVHAAGVKRIVVKSSAGGVEVEHRTYGR